MSTLKQLVNETSNIKNDLVRCRNNLEANLVAKGVEVVLGSKVSTLVDNVGDIEVLPSIEYNINASDCNDIIFPSLYSSPYCMYNSHTYGDFVYITYNVAIDAANNRYVSYIIKFNHITKELFSIKPSRGIILSSVIYNDKLYTAHEYCNIEVLSLEDLSKISTINLYFTNSGDIGYLKVIKNELYVNVKGYGSYSTPSRIVKLVNDTPSKTLTFSRYQYEYCVPIYDEDKKQLIFIFSDTGWGDNYIVTDLELNKIIGSKNESVKYYLANSSFTKYLGDSTAIAFGSTYIGKLDINTQQTISYKTHNLITNENIDFYKTSNMILNAFDSGDTVTFYTGRLFLNIDYNTYEHDDLSFYLPVKSTSIYGFLPDKKYFTMNKGFLTKYNKKIGAI